MKTHAYFHMDFPPPFFFKPFETAAIKQVLQCCDIVILTL